MLPRSFTLAATAIFSSVVLSACAADIDDSFDETGESESAVTETKTVPLLYEGTCEFLRTCSVWSRGRPEGPRLWGCSAENTVRGENGVYGACSDTELWVAGPTRSHCGRTVRICKDSTCVDAKVVDISVSQSWEASNGVLEALGLPYGLTSQCGGYGGGTVTITDDVPG